jgi:hypothetical protein
MVKNIFLLQSKRMFVNKFYVRALLFQCGTVAAHQMTKQDEREKR